MGVGSILRLAIRGLNSPPVRKLAQKVIYKVKVGDIKEANKGANILKRTFYKGTSRLKQVVDKQKPLSKNVDLRRELYYNPHTQTAGTGYFGQFKKTPMIDMDVAGPSHYAYNVGHKTKKDALRALSDFTKSRAGKKSLFKVYETPGGLRLFDLSRRTSPRGYYQTGNSPSMALGDDISYVNYNLKRGGFASRLSPKPGRVDDYVAKPLGYAGRGKAHPLNRLEVKRYHDRLIAQIVRNSTKDKISIGGLFDMIGR
jgi:hypothetical protein|tara:strand:+ start:1212 stop:1979 length:768 start_codon:yes stop_codon:yes gene_type:complete